MKKLAGGFIVFLFAVLFLTSASFAEDYKIVDLGALGGSESGAEGGNDSGQVVGYSYIAGDTAQHAFLYNGGVMTDLGTLGGTNSGASAINDSAQVAGDSDIAGDTARHAFIYSGGIMTDLGTLGGTSSSANGINDSAQVVGGSDIAGDTARHAFIYSGGVMTDLGTLGGTNSGANGINDSGQVVGDSDIAEDAGRHAFLYSGGIMTDLGTLGGTSSSANGINDSGQVVGDSDMPGDAARHAFIYRDGVMIDLGTLGGTNSYAIDINDAGQVVGYSDIAGDAARHAFLWRAGVMTDLNSLLSPESGWILIYAADLRDNGQAAGTGIINGQNHAFLMAPDQDPSPSFGFTYGSPNTLIVNVNASGSYCVSGSCLYEWNWGDGDTDPFSGGPTASHTYAAAGTYAVTLTVKDAVYLSTASRSVNVNVYAPDFRPSADGCGEGEYTWNANTWTFSCDPASTDDNGVAKEIIKWNDGTANYVDAAAPFAAASHTFTTAGIKLISHTAVDTIGQTSAAEMATVVAAPFAISGAVYKHDGTTPAQSVRVQIRKAVTGTVVYTVFVRADGTFTAGNLKPGAYDLFVSKHLYNFGSGVGVPHKSFSITVGPSSSGNIINAVTP
ncbi:MAG: PKD domain-containing protein [Nitrospirae bacterium]|nr:PKD domain-containing protein [Nitrospirota bacterium]